MFSEYVIEFTKPGKYLQKKFYNERRTFADNLRDFEEREHAFINKLITENRSFHAYRETRPDLGEEPGIETIMKRECVLNKIPTFMDKKKLNTI